MEATIYGVALNYATVKCKVSRMTINFERNDMIVVMLDREMEVCETLNLLASVLS